MSLFGSILDVPNRKNLLWHTMLLTTQILIFWQPLPRHYLKKAANGYIYSVRFNVAWEIFGATIDVSSRIDKDQSALDEIKRDLEWELSSDFNTNDILFVTDYDAPKVSVKNQRH